MIETRDIILKLRAVQKEKKYSYTQILKMMDKNGDHVGKSTLSRLFGKNWEKESFKYEDTLRPIAKVLLDMETIEEDDGLNIQAMKMLLKYKIERIEELEAKIRELTQTVAREKIKRHEAVDEERRRFDRQEDLYREQLAYKDKRMDSFIEAMFKKDEQIKEMMEKILRCQKCEHNEG